MIKMYKKLFSDIRFIYLLLLWSILNFACYVRTIPQKLKRAYYDGCIMKGSEIEPDGETKYDCEKLKEKYGE